MTFKLSFTMVDTKIEAQSDTGSSYSVTFTDIPSGKAQDKHLSAEALGAILNAAIAGVDDGPLYDAASPHCSDLARELRPIP